MAAEQTVDVSERRNAVVLVATAIASATRPSSFVVSSTPARAPSASDVHSRALVTGAWASENLNPADAAQDARCDAAKILTEATPTVLKAPRTNTGTVTLRCRCCSSGVCLGPAILSTVHVMGSTSGSFFSSQISSSEKGYGEMAPQRRCLRKPTPFSPSVFTSFSAPWAAALADRAASTGVRSPEEDVRAYAGALWAVEHCTFFAVISFPHTAISNRWYPLGCHVAEIERIDRGVVSGRFGRGLDRQVNYAY